MDNRKSRAAFYYDGFNLYHSVVDLGRSYLKWLNLRKLSESLVCNTEQVTRVVFCSAYYPGDEKKKFRHDQFMNALKLAEVDCIMGHYIHEPKDCRSCGASWQQPNEKASDINLSLSLITDAYLDVYDNAYLVTADTDQVATAQYFKRLFPNKRIITVAPPGRDLSSHLQRFTDDSVKINPDFLEYCLFDKTVIDPSGKSHGRRPREYDPPNDWVAPVNRLAKPPKSRV